MNLAGHRNCHDPVEAGEAAGPGDHEVQPTDKLFYQGYSGFFLGCFFTMMNSNLTSRIGRLAGDEAPSR